MTHDEVRGNIYKDLKVTEVHGDALLAITRLELLISDLKKKLEVYEIYD